MIDINDIVNEFKEMYINLFFSLTSYVLCKVLAMTHLISSPIQSYLNSTGN